VKETKANTQHKSIISVLRAVAPTLVCEHINFGLGSRRSVVESDFYTKLKKIDAQEEKER